MGRECSSGDHRSQSKECGLKVTFQRFDFARGEIKTVTRDIDIKAMLAANPLMRVLVEQVSRKGARSV